MESYFVGKIFDVCLNATIITRSIEIMLHKINRDYFLSSLQNSKKGSDYTTRCKKRIYISFDALKNYYHNTHVMKLNLTLIFEISTVGPE